MKEYQRVNKVRFDAYKKQYALKMKLLGVSRVRKVADMSPEEREAINLKRRIYRKKNLGKKREENHNYKSKKRTTGRLSPGIIQALLVLQGGDCACGGQKLNYDYHLDHIVPIAVGGTNTDDNVQLLLAKCNMQKGTLSMEEFMRKRANSV